MTAPPPHRRRRRLRGAPLADARRRRPRAAPAARAPRRGARGRQAAREPSPSLSLRVSVAVALASCLVAGVGGARARRRGRTGPRAIPNTTPAELQGVDIVEHLGGPLPRDAAFRDTEGKAVKLGDFFDGKRPTLFVFAYHTCPMLCSLVLDATVKSLNDVPWTVGDEFDVVSVSIDPKDTPETATKKRAQVVAVVPARPRQHPAAGTSSWATRRTSARSPTPSASSTATTRGRSSTRTRRPSTCSRPRATSPATSTASSTSPRTCASACSRRREGRSISTTERILLFCYHYDPQGKHYSLVAMNVMRLGGGVTLVLIGGFLTIMWARERRRRKRASSPADHAPSTAGAHPS